MASSVRPSHGSAHPCASCPVMVPALSGDQARQLPRGCKQLWAQNAGRQVWAFAPTYQSPRSKKLVSKALVCMHRHGAGSNGDAARHDDGQWHAHAAWNGHGCSWDDGHAHAASSMMYSRCHAIALICKHFLGQPHSAVILLCFG